MDTPSKPEALSADSLDDLRIRAIRPLVPAACLIDDIAGDEAVYDCVAKGRKQVAR